MIIASYSLAFSFCQDRLQFLFQFVFTFFAACPAGQNVPTLTIVEQEQVYKILAFEKHKANADFLDSNFLTSNEHLETYLGLPQPEKRMKAMANRRNVSTRDKVILNKGK